MRVNPFEKHYALCNTGWPEDKQKNIADFPHLIDLELTSACNFRCLMCPTGNLSLARPSTFMSPTIFGKIVGECSVYGTALRFIGWGEPLLHPAIAGFVELASENFLDTHINTNGSKLTPELSEELIAAGLKSIKFSFQGVDRKSYAEMRNRDWFDGLIETMTMFRKVRDDREFPFIAATTSITYESPETVAEFRKLVEPLVDDLGVGTTVFDYMDLSAVRLSPDERERLERLKTFESTNKRHPVPCPEVWDKLSIHADGSAAVCCNDFNGTVSPGNVNETSILKLWRHPKLEAYRERLAKQDYSSPLCKDCFDYMDCTKNVVAA